MAEKTELIFFSEYKIGGVQNYYYNLIANDPDNDFSKLWIFVNNENSDDARLPEKYNDICDQVIFSYNNGEVLENAKRLSNYISNKPGIVMTNHPIELISLHRFRRNNKTIIHVCHDELYLKFAKDFEFLIDVFIAHNICFYHELRKIMPDNRRKDIYYLPYGVTVPDLTRKPNTSDPLKIAFIARLDKKKGIFDLPQINDILSKDDIEVEWRVIGSGPEKDKLRNLLKDKPNFSFYSPDTTNEVLMLASQCDVFILPSYLDGLPVALLEAMSVGLVPVISRFNEGIDAVVEKSDGFIVAVGDNKAFAEKIKFLHFNRNVLETLSVASKNKVRNKYEIKSKVQGYYQLFKQFKELKKPIKRKWIKYDGVLDYPFIPATLRKLIRKFK